MSNDKVSNYTTRKLKPHDIIIEVSGGTQEQPVGRALLVTRDVIDRLNGGVICASFCKLVRLNTGIISPLFYYYWMKFLYDTRIIDRFQLQSTGIINFQFDFFLNKGDVMLPPMELMQQFDTIVMPIMDQISATATEKVYFKKCCQSAPFYFSEDECPTDDEFFEYFRAISFAHPYSTDRNKKIKDRMGKQVSPLGLWNIALFCHYKESKEYMKRTKEYFLTIWAYYDMI